MIIAFISGLLLIFLLLFYYLFISLIFLLLIDKYFNLLAHIFKKNNATEVSMLDLLNITTAKSTIYFLHFYKFNQQMFSEHLLHTGITPTDKLPREKTMNQS